MKIEVFPKAALEAKWDEIKKLYAPDAMLPTICLRCGAPMHTRLPENALSRHCSAMICSKCGTDEAMRDYGGDPLPLTEWYAVKQGLVQPDQPEGCAVLRQECVFQRVFDGPKKTTPLSNWPVPESKVLHCRADYDGHKWWRTWHPCHDAPLGDDLCAEINDFSDSLMKLPEFENLDTLRFFCKENAAPTSERTEFNLYSETEHFFIWLRMITRERDYNLYVSFYMKRTTSEE